MADMGQEGKQICYAVSVSSNLKANKEQKQNLELLLFNKQWCRFSISTKLSIHNGIEILIIDLESRSTEIFVHASYS